jgi:hypothetical protein
LWKDKKLREIEWTKIQPVVEMAKVLENKINPAKSGKPLLWSPEAKVSLKCAVTSGVIVDNISCYIFIICATCTAYSEL